MRYLVSETASQLLGILVSAVGSLLFTLWGFLAEQAAVRNVLAGHLTAGLWEAAFGLIFLTLGVYLIGYGEFWPRLNRLREQRA